MEILNFMERTMLREFLKQSEKGVLNKSYRQIANEIGGVTHQTIKNYLMKFVDCGIATISNKGTCRQSFKFKISAVQRLLDNE